MFADLPADRLASFLDAIHTEPDSDEPRLVFADWLEDHGDPRAELIRLQCEWSRLSQRDPRHRVLLERDLAWRDKNAAGWLGKTNCCGVGWERGLPMFSARPSQLQQADLRLLQLFREGWAADLAVQVGRLEGKRVVCSRLQGLRTLHLWGEGIGGVIKRQMELPNLLALRLDCRSSDRLDLQSLKQWPQLRRLEVWAMFPMDAAAVESLQQLPHLQALSLRGSSLDGPGSQLLGQMKQLRELDLWSATNRLVGRHWEFLRELTSLRVLNLSNTSVHSVGLKCLQGLTALQTLLLENVPFTSGDLEVVRAMPRLRTLDLSETRIGVGSLAHLVGLTELETLLLGGTSIKDEDLGHLRGLTHLRKLVLPVQITDEGLKHLRSLSNLEMLDLVGTNVSDEGLAYLNELPRLRWLRVQYIDDVSEEGLADLQRCLPQLWIDRGEG